MRTLATNANIGFVLRNALRDAGTIAVTSEYLPPVPLWAQADGFARVVRRMAGQADAADAYFAAGLQGGAPPASTPTARGSELARNVRRPVAGSVMRA